MKRILTVLCTFMIALSIASFGPVKAEASAGPYTDVPSKYEDAVTYLYHNVMGGMAGDTRFYPDKPITRGRLMVLLYKMAGSPSVSGSMPFKDVLSSESYYKAVLWAYKNGITSGTSATTFSPEANVTYQEIFTFIHAFSSKIVRRESAVRSTYYLQKPKNLDKYSSWAQSHAQWAYNNGIVYGVNRNIFNPNVFTPKASVTRGDAAFFLYNYYRSFQNRYAFLGTNCNLNHNGVEHGMNSLNVIKKLFLNTLSTNSNTIILKYSSGINTSSDLINCIYDAFKNSTCIDQCYLYLCSRGTAGGMQIYHDGTKLTPQKLLSYLGSYKGHITIMLEADYSGIFHTYFTSQDNGKKFSILTSSDGHHQSQVMTGTPVGVATYYWAYAVKDNLNITFRQFMTALTVQSQASVKIKDYNINSGYEYQKPLVYDMYTIIFTKKF